MTSFSMDLKMSASEVFSEIQHCIGTADYTVKTIVPNQSVIAEGNRDFSWLIVIIFAILLWPVAIVYYLTRQRSSITATINKDSENECNVTITSNGNSGDNLTRLIQNVLQEDKSKDKSKDESEDESRLKERYEKGELSKGEFENMKKDLENS